MKKTYRIAIQRLLKKRRILLPILLFLPILLLFLSPWFGLESPILQHRNHILQPPFWQSGEFHFLLGTDKLGRDLLSRLIFGAQNTLFAAFFITLITFILGMFLATFSSLSSWFSFWILKLNDIFLVFPGILLAMVLSFFLGGGLQGVIIAVSIAHTPRFVRFVRSVLFSELHSLHVLNSRLLGASFFRLIFFCVLPNILPFLSVELVLTFSFSLLDTSALGFLGLGVSSPTPELGSMLADARENGFNSWWLVVFPGAFVFLFVLLVNYMRNTLSLFFDLRRQRREM